MSEVDAGRGLLPNKHVIERCRRSVKQTKTVKILLDIVPDMF